MLPSTVYFVHLYQPVSRREKPALVVCNRKEQQLSLQETWRYGDICNANKS